MDAGNVDRTRAPQDFTLSDWLILAFTLATVPGVFVGHRGTSATIRRACATRRLRLPTQTSGGMERVVRKWGAATSFCATVSP